MPGTILVHGLWEEVGLIFTHQKHWLCRYLYENINVMYDQSATILLFGISVVYSMHITCSMHVFHMHGIFRWLATAGCCIPQCKLLDLLQPHFYAKSVFFLCKTWFKNVKYAFLTLIKHAHAMFIVAHCFTCFLKNSMHYELHAVQYAFVQIFFPCYAIVMVMLPYQAWLSVLHTVPF